VKLRWGSDRQQEKEKVKRQGQVVELGVDQYVGKTDRHNVAIAEKARERYQVGRYQKRQRR